MKKMFSALVSGDADVSGALAYASYTRIENEWREEFRSLYMRPPNEVEEENFINVQLRPENIASLKHRSCRMASHYLKEGLKDRVSELAVEVCHSEISERFSVLEERVRSTLQQIQAQLNEKKSISAWMKEIGTAFVSSLALVVIVGVILTGYVGLGKLTAATEKVVGIGPDPAYKTPIKKPLSAPGNRQEAD